MGRKKDYGFAIGTRFGSLTTISEQFYGSDGKRKTIARVRCKCDCGKELDVNCYLLQAGYYHSCGCKRRTQRADYGRWVCRRCGMVFGTRMEMFDHSKSVHNSRGRNWAKGRTKETDPVFKHISDVMNRKIATGEYVNPFKGKKLSLNHRLKISNAMIKAHSEGRSHNIGTCRWNNEPSYPESFFIRVIENNFDDKDYIREFPFARFSLDFAWVKKRKCIEIDGDQHWRFKEVLERDKIKDSMLTSAGWKVLRIKWIDMYKNPKEWISKAKDFIDG